MDNLVGTGGKIAGYLGALVCLIAGLARAVGYYYIAGYQSTTLFTVGVGLMVFACMLKLDAMQAPPQP